jgi:pimeloyl-ACP methyl ester carboxylesterase
MSVNWTDTVKEVAGGKLYLSRAGRGPTVLMLHHDIGTPDRLPFYDALAERFDVLVPHFPGWGKSERLEWLRHPRDISAIMSWLLADLEVRDVSLLGLGFGGWVAAEMASQAVTTYRRMVLVGAHGIKPPEGDILDQAIISYIDYPKAGFHEEVAFTRVFGEVSTDQLEAWDIAREMSFRTAWKPYMYSQTLPHLLGGVRAPTLVVWGDDDRIVPISAGKAYVQALRNATMTTVAGCGHFVDMEKPQELAKITSEFLLKSN